MTDLTERLREIPWKKTIRNLALGVAVLGFGIGAVQCYLRTEDAVVKKIFCDEYSHLKGQPTEIIKKEGEKYWGKIVDSQRKGRKINYFVEWVNGCE